MRGAWAIGALTAGGLAGACVNLQAYVCSADEECNSAMGSGTCEASGYCSYPDEDCPSGRRYGDLAGALGRQCVDEDGTGSTTVGSESGDGGTTTTTDPTLDSSDDDGSSDTGIPVCGNGVVEGDEECDELDDVSGDGCNPDCVASGSVRWSAVVSGKDGNDRLFGLIQLATDDVVAVGYTTLGSRDILLTRWTVDGVEVQTASYDVDGGADEAEAVTQDGLGQLWVCGRATIAGTQRPWMGEWDPLLTADPEATQELPVEVEGYCHDLVHLEGSSFAAVGGSGSQAWSYRFSSGNLGGGTVAIPVPPMGQSGESRLKEAVRAPGGEVLLAGQDEEVGVAFEPPSAGDVGTSLVQLLDTQLQSMAVTDDTIVLAGWHYVPASLDDMWISAHQRADGTELWSWSAPRRTLVDEIEDIALDPAGNVYAIGHVSNDDPDRWVGKLDPAGTLVWEREDYEGSLLGPDRGRSLVVLPDGELIVVGEFTTAAGDLDGWIARLAP